MQRALGLCAPVVALVAFALGCDSAGDASPDATAASAQSVKNGTARAGQAMVAAVSAGEGPSSVDVKFELTRRPEVGKPVDIALALIPTGRLELLYARFQADEGLELVKGGQTEQIARPAAGSPVSHTVTVIPKRDGIFTVTAVVLTDSDSDSVSRNFSIPLIAGSGLPEWSAKPTAAQPATAGERTAP